MPEKRIAWKQSVHDCKVCGSKHYNKANIDYCKKHWLELLMKRDSIKADFIEITNKKMLT